MRGSMVDGKCSSSAAAFSNDSRMVARSACCFRRNGQKNTGMLCGKGAPECAPWNCNLCLCQKDREARLVGVIRAITIHVIHGGDFYVAWAQAGVGNLDHLEMA